MNTNRYELRLAFGPQDERAAQRPRFIAASHRNQSVLGWLCRGIAQGVGER